MGINYSDELYHHGILGQKWGIRRTPEQLGYRLSKKKQETQYKGALSADKEARIRNKQSLARTKAQAKAEKLRNRQEMLSIKNQIRAEKASERQYKKNLREDKAAQRLAKKQEKYAKKHDKELEKAIADGNVKKILKHRGKLSNEELTMALERAKMTQEFRDLKTNHAFMRINNVLETIGNVGSNSKKVLDAATVGYTLLNKKETDRVNAERATFKFEREKREHQEDRDIKLGKNKENTDTNTNTNADTKTKTKAKLSRGVGLKPKAVLSGQPRDNDGVSIRDGIEIGKNAFSPAFNQIGGGIGKAMQAKNKRDEKRRAYNAKVIAKNVSYKPMATNTGTPIINKNTGETAGYAIRYIATPTKRKKR